MKIEHKQFKAFALPFIISAFLLLAIGGCSDDTTTMTATLSSTDDDGVAELTSVPDLPATFTTSDTSMDVDISVDTDTEFVDVYLHPVGDSTTTVAAANDQTVTAGTTNTITLTVSTAPTAGTDYYIELIACAAATTSCQFSVSTFTSNDTGYIDTDPTTGIYQTIDLTDGTEVSTGVTIPTITAE